MRFFAKLVMICNGCFLATIVLSMMEQAQKKQGHFDGLIQLKPLQSTLVVLGYSAILINLLYLLLVLAGTLFGKSSWREGWLPKLNLLFFLGQVYYFFFT